MNTILEFLARPAIRFGGIALAIAWAITAWNISQMRAESRGAVIGEQKANQKTEAQNAKVKEDGRSGASHRGVPVPGSVRDPRYRND